MAALIALALPSSAYATFPSVAGGKFEVTCKPAAIPDQSIDPIVSPGVVSAHKHTFFGNRGLTNVSTPASLQASTAGTTCVLAQDTAAYWVPVACDGPCVDAFGMPTESDPVNVVKPVKIFAYYFGTKGVKPVQFPSNLELIGGNSHATSAPGKHIAAFHCGNGGSHHSPVRAYPYDCTAANGVRGTDGVVAVTLFPYCLASDGSVGYGDAVSGSCPAGTQTLGQVQIHVHYGHNTSGYQMGSRLNFTSGPYWTFHGDWMNGWQQSKLQSLVSGCLDLNKDCGFLNNSHPGP